MRFGCCGSMIAPTVDPIGIEIVETLAEIGFDYVELSLRDLATLDTAEFAAARRRLERTRLVCETCNNFFPATIRLTGVDADHTAAVAHAEAALTRAEALGTSVVVFGSSGAKNVPPGFPHAIAWSQVVDLLRRLGDVAARRGVTIAIEHLNRGEANLIVSVEEGLELMRRVDHPAVRMLIDHHHMLVEAEPVERIDAAGLAIVHTHVAAGLDRRFPVDAAAVPTAFFARLAATGYRGRCSIEAYTDRFDDDARRALALLRRTVAELDAPADATTPFTPKEMDHAE